MYIFFSFSFKFTFISPLSCFSPDAIGWYCPASAGGGGPNIFYTPEHWRFLFSFSYL